MTNSASPCRKICKFDEAIGLCTGCWRNLDEIARWASLSEAERTAIKAGLPQRERRFARLKPVSLTGALRD